MLAGESGSALSRELDVKRSKLYEWASQLDRFGGTWFIDANGDQSFDPGTGIRGWGVAGWTPVPGRWQ